MKPRFVNLLFVVVVCATLPVRAQNLKCFILTPPDQILGGVKQIAIADFTVTASFSEDDSPGEKGKKGLEKILSTVEKISDMDKNKARFSDSGRKLSDAMLTMLIENDRGVRDLGTGFLGLGKKKEGKSFQTGAITNVFNVVERAQFERVVSELQLGQTGIVNEATAAQVGKLLGVDAMIIGNVSVAVEDRWLKEEREDKNKVKTQVDCEKLIANVSASIRIVKVETGQVLGSKDDRQKFEKKKCKDSWGDLPTPEAAVEECIAKAARNLVNYFAPRFELEKFDFAKLEGEEFKRANDVAKKALEDYDLNTAYLQYASIVENDSYNDAALFNLGVLYEVVGSYKQAKEKYDLAFNLKSKEGKYRDAIKRAGKQVEFWNELNALGIAITEYQFTVSQEEMAAASRSRIETKGPRAARHEIKAAPDAGSATVARVPGEIELELIEAKDNWFKVKLPDGKEGYLPQASGKVIK
jgi:tetratricopeptide (TPR) repeat protein